MTELFPHWVIPHISLKKYTQGQGVSELWILCPPPASKEVGATPHVVFFISGLPMSSAGNKWIEEELEPGLRVQYGLNQILATSKSKFQTVDLVDLQTFGRVLLIDGLIQSSQSDEFVYHESLVHPALLAHPNPKSVYIGGGGEGSTAREVLRHKSVERCVMVDIDEDVVRFCRDHLPENSEAFKDPRLELIIDDAKAILEKSPTGFDVIIMDLDDPLEGGEFRLSQFEQVSSIHSSIHSVPNMARTSHGTHPTCHTPYMSHAPFPLDMDPDDRGRLVSYHPVFTHMSHTPHATHPTMPHTRQCHTPTMSHT